MTSSRRSSTRIVPAILRLVETRGWDHVTLESIAKAAKIPVATIKKEFADKRHILPLIVDYVSEQAWQSVGKINPTSLQRDRLFEILMARFDALQKHRKAILSIVESVKRDPCATQLVAKAQIKTMREIIAKADIGSDSPADVLAPIALWGIFVFALRIWRSDETLDMSRTMASLDRALRWADTLATFLRR